MRLIDADVLLEHWEERKRPNYHENLAAYYQHLIMGNMIRDAKTIDAVPVVHGEWIVDEKRFGNSNKHCSRCRAILEKSDDEWRNNYYCYHCGAKMDGERKEKNNEVN